MLMAAPAPLASGAHTYLSPTRPTLTRTYSLCLSDETSLRESTASISLSPDALNPENLLSTGYAKFSIARYADTGYPGIPITGLPHAFARMTGFPGFMATP